MNIIYNYSFRLNPLMTFSNEVEFDETSVELICTKISNVQSFVKAGPTTAVLWIFTTRFFRKLSLFYYLQNPANVGNIIIINPKTIIHRY